jgi:hypothetical protein
MRKKDVVIGGRYLAKVSEKLTWIIILGESIHGGWLARSESTGRAIRIRTAARLRRRSPEKVK